jgi:hypothetical protein
MLVQEHITLRRRRRGDVSGPLVYGKPFLTFAMMAITKDETGASPLKVPASGGGKFYRVKGSGPAGFGGNGLERYLGLG